MRSQMYAWKKSVYGNASTLKKEGLQRLQVLKLHSSLYRLKDDAKIWHDLFVNQIRDLRLQDLRTAPSVYHDKEVFVIGYV